MAIKVVLHMRASRTPATTSKVSLPINRIKTHHRLSHLLSNTWHQILINRAINMAEWICTLSSILQICITSVRAIVFRDSTSKKTTYQRVRWSTKTTKSTNYNRKKTTIKFMETNLIWMALMRKSQRKGQRMTNNWYRTCSERSSRSSRSLSLKSKDSHLRIMVILTKWIPVVSHNRLNRGNRKTVRRLKRAYKVISCSNSSQIRFYPQTLWQCHNNFQKTTTT